MLGCLCNVPQWLLVGELEFEPGVTLSPSVHHVAFVWDECGGQG